MRARRHVFASTVSTAALLVAACGSGDATEHRSADGHAGRGGAGSGGGPPAGAGGAQRDPRGIDGAGKSGASEGGQSVGGVSGSCPRCRADEGGGGAGGFDTGNGATTVGGGRTGGSDAGGSGHAGGTAGAAGTDEDETGGSLPGGTGGTGGGLLGGTQPTGGASTAGSAGTAGMAGSGGASTASLAGTAGTAGSGGASIPGLAGTAGVAGSAGAAGNTGVAAMAGIEEAGGSPTGGNQPTGGSSTGGSGSGGVGETGGGSTGGTAGMAGAAGVAGNGNSAGAAGAGGSAAVAGSSNGGSAGYAPSSEYLVDPDRCTDVLQSLADFRARARDDVNGGFFSVVKTDGTVGTDRRKGFVTSSRDVWTFSRAFMVTGDETYLDHAAHALEHLLSHGWDSTNGGWYFLGDEMGNISAWGNGSKTAFVQHYALLGIGAYCDATRNASACSWLLDGRSLLDTAMWDSDSSRLGYYDQADLDFGSPRNKGFTATVDALTTNAIQMELLSPAEFHQRMVDLADIVDHRLAANMDLSIVQFGFPESYDTDWNVNTSETNNDVGHVLKSAWVLARVYLRNPDPRYRAAARKFIYEVLNNGGWNDEHGVPYTTANWSSGAQTMKTECWQIEQAITSGLSNWYIADDETDSNTYLEMADRSLQFFADYVIDHTYGGTWKLNNLSGTPSGSSKSNFFNVEYHSTETFWFTYLYGNLLLHREPVVLYYMIPPSPADQTLQLTPLAVDDGSLEIQSATLDGEPLHTFDGPKRELTLFAGEGGKLRVVFGPAT